MSKLRRVVGPVLILAIGGLAAGWWWWSSRESEATAGRLVLYGNIDIREVDLAINGNDRIAEVLVEEGDRVTKGTLLARLDTGRLQHLVESAEARMQAQAQVVARLEAGTRPEEIDRARAELEAAKALAEDREQNYQREIELREQHAATERELDNALAERDAAVARKMAAAATLDLAVAGPRIEDIAEAKARLKQDQADLALARHDLDDASLYAPNDGVIRNRMLEVGDMASPQKPVYTMALIDRIWVRAYVSETNLGRIAPGMEATITTDSFPGKRYGGWVGFISPTAEFTPKFVQTTDVRTKLVYEVRVFARNPDDDLRLGMPATVTVDLDGPGH